jgi:F420-non-reducing hydrogenase iron-sulfur subunit
MADMNANDEPLKLYIFFCSNSFDINELNGALTQDHGDEFKIISLPCSGKANLLYFIKAFETGADGLVLITCPKNECRHLEGNLRSPKRAEEVNSLLEEIGMGRDRIIVLNINGQGHGPVMTRIAEFSDSIRKLKAAQGTAKKEDSRVGAS